jgi:asparagine synthase (glutamine-hydrolysing)
MNIDAGLRYKGGVSKYLLKEVLYEYLPKEMFSRPKWGFSIPLSEWMRGRYKWLMDKYLSPTIINRYGIMSNIFVQQLKQRFLAGEDYLYVRLWTIIILHWWLEENA